MAEIGFIGVGNMGSVLAHAVCEKKGGEHVTLADGLPGRAASVAQSFGCKASDNLGIAGSCDIIFIGVKPQGVKALMDEIGPVLSARTDRFILVSMVAATSTARMRALAGQNHPIIRIMPNTPAAVGAGTMVYCAEDVTDEECAEFEAMMAETGLVDRLPEHLIDAAMSVFGCGPAFVYLFIEAMADGAVACDLPRDKAQMYAAQTLLGASKLVIESGEHPGHLKDKVCSPGGTTIAGVRELEENGFRSAVMEAVVASFEKARKMG